jgi:predicted nucleic acid-binding protein
LDASATLSWLLADERDEAALAMLHAVSTRGALVPVLWRAELQNALVTAERKNRLAPDQSAAMLDDLACLPIEFDPRPPPLDFVTEVALARRFELSAYDATYLELAFRRGAPLLTRDAALASAASALGLLWSPGE